MKKLFFAALCLLSAQFSIAQALILQNTATCMGEVQVIVYAEAGAGACGPGSYYSDPITCYANSGASFDFGKPGMFFPWSAATGAPPAPFNIVRIEVFNPCTGPVASASTCTSNTTDFYSLDNPNCGANTIVNFEYSTNCLSLCPHCPPVLCNACPSPLTPTVEFQSPGPWGSAWGLLVY